MGNYFLQLRVSPPIGEALAADDLEGFVCAMLVIDAECAAHTVVEINLPHVAHQVVISNMMKRPNESSLGGSHFPQYR